MKKFKLPTVSLQGSRSYVTTGGRVVNERRTFSQVMSPINMRPDGMPKTREEIMDELRVECRRWCHEKIEGERATGIVVDEWTDIINAPMCEANPPIALTVGNTNVTNGSGK